jgi:hypothetical protein
VPPELAPPLPVFPPLDAPPVEVLPPDALPPDPTPPLPPSGELDEQAARPADTTKDKTQIRVLRVTGASAMGGVRGDSPGAA